MAAVMAATTMRSVDSIYCAAFAPRWCHFDNTRGARGSISSSDTSYHRGCRLITTTTTTPCLACLAGGLYLRHLDE